MTQKKPTSPEGVFEPKKRLVLYPAPVRPELEKILEAAKNIRNQIGIDVKRNGWVVSREDGKYLTLGKHRSVRTFRSDFTQARIFNRKQDAMPYLRKGEFLRKVTIIITED